MRVLFVCSEVYSLAKTGGLADVCGALPRALNRLGVDVQIALPGYPQAIANARNVHLVADLAEDGPPTRLLAGLLPDSEIPVWLVQCDSLFARPGSLYRDPSGADWPDNPYRFGLFNKVVARLAKGEFTPGWRPDIVHAHDWHAGLLPALLKQSNDAPASIFTIHNLAYQGVFPQNGLAGLGLPQGIMEAPGLEFYGKASFLKAGIVFSDRVTTVSPSYAREIVTPEFGCGLDGVLRDRSALLSGILNGVDYAVWSPANDTFLDHPIKEPADKRRAKAALQAELGLEKRASVPIVAWLSRLTDQKMADVASEVLHMMLNREVQFALVGEGEPALEQRFREAAQHYPGRLAVRIGYEEPLAHRLLAGADILLHPSRFEPCGLTPLYAMRYGVLPIVRQVGGLNDTVIDASEWTVRAGNATGFAFAEEHSKAMVGCLDKALAYYAQPAKWKKMQQRAMSRTFSWEISARRYVALYQQVLLERMPVPLIAGTGLVPQELPELPAAKAAQPALQVAAG
jgi:starch synthase